MNPFVVLLLSAFQSGMATSSPSDSNAPATASNNNNNNNNNNAEPILPPLDMTGKLYLR